MSDSRKRLADFKESGERPSLIYVKTIVESMISNGSTLTPDPDNILNGFKDQEYFPNLEEIRIWVEKETESMRYEINSELDAILEDNENAEGEFDRKLKVLNEKSVSTDTTEAEMVENFADLFSWMDRIPFFRGASLGKYWHVAMVQSALLEMDKKTSLMMDCLHNLLRGILDGQIQGIEITKRGSINGVDFNELKKGFEVHQATLKLALQTRGELVELAVKIGFLYRDSWWLEKHGDAALKGYVYQETSAKAGSGGSKASIEARRKRIECFLVVHAKMIRENPVLSDDPPDDLAFRALKLARKANPAIMGKASARKTALEYWEYINSDFDLRN